ncbi:phage baseplate assembly protein V [Breoghania sp.]|uniref:phage baseplate assembly protein V n=1 Tax=Breoghania sp. TaxID=2065378 RepID=UPI002AA7BB84|nr:phage baseplate assembly protein V [Breoghania sp.]
MSIFLRGRVMFERRDAEITDLHRRQSSALVIGYVSDVDHKKARYRVAVGDLKTDWLPMVQRRAGDRREYTSLSAGEQVLVASPGGEMSQGVIVGSISTNETQPADKGNIHRTIYPDGTVVEYDHEAKAYSMEVANGGSFTMKIGGGVSIEAKGDKLKIAAPGGIEMTGEVLDVNTTDINHNSINIGETHRHTEVVRGAQLSGPPEG